jgi:hypothetical protein
MLPDHTAPHAMVVSSVAVAMCREQVSVCGAGGGGEVQCPFGGARSLLHLLVKAVRLSVRLGMQ